MNEANLNQRYVYFVGYKFFHALLKKDYSRLSRQDCAALKEFQSQLPAHADFWLLADEKSSIGSCSVSGATNVAVRELHLKH